MNKYLLLFSILFLPLFSQADVLKNHTGAYMNFWDADRLDDGTGFGVSLDYRLLGIVFVEGNAGYVDFDDGWVVPMETSLNLKLPLPLTPYIGVGGGYYVADHKTVDNGWGTHMKLGGMLQLFSLGVFAEARYMDLDENALDGYNYLLGVTFKF